MTHFSFSLWLIVQSPEFRHICLFSRICPITFAWRMWITFKQQKLYLGVLLSTCLIFWQFQSDIACKSVAYKKSVYFQLHGSTCSTLGHFVLFLKIKIFYFQGTCHVEHFMFHCFKCFFKADFYQLLKPSLFEAIFLHTIWCWTLTSSMTRSFFDLLRQRDVPYGTKFLRV